MIDCGVEIRLHVQEASELWDRATEAARLHAFFRELVEFEICTSWLAWLPFPQWVATYIVWKTGRKFKRYLQNSRDLKAFVEGKL
jgi:hypothetical protein